jgi:hypothetical protein
MITFHKLPIWNTIVCSIGNVRASAVPLWRKVGKALAILPKIFSFQYIREKREIDDRNFFVV